MPENPLYEQYDKFIPVFGTQGSEWPQMRLFLSMVKENFTVAGGSAFRQTQYPEVVSENYTKIDGTAPKTSGDKYAAVPFFCFLGEWLSDCGGLEVQSGAPAATPETVSGAEKITALVEGVKTPWFRSFMMSILEAPNQVDQIVPALTSFKFKSSEGIREILKLENLFYGIPSPYLDPASELGKALDGKKLGSFAGLLLAAKGTSVCKGFKGESTPIGYRWDRYLLSFFLKTKVESYKASSFWDEVPAESTITAPANTFFREVGHPDKLFTMKDGNKVEIQPGSDEWKTLKEGDNCFDMGFVTGEGGKTCAQFIEQCLSGKNIDQCKDFMSSPSFWTKAPQEVANTDPTIAKQLLLQFGFVPKETEYKEIGMTLKAMPTVNEWLSGLKTNFPDAFGGDAGMQSLKNIGENEKLVGFLRLLVKKVNESPGILNPSYTPGAETMSDASLKLTQFGQMGILPKFHSKYTPTASNSESFSRFKQAVIQSRTYYGNYLLIGTPVVGYGLFGGAQNGGDMAPISEGVVSRIQAIQDGSSFPKPTSAMIEEFYNFLLASLGAINRDLDTGDKNKITEFIAKLKQYEDKLFSSAVYMAKYIDLVSVFGKEDKSGLINFDNIKTFVEKHDSYFEKASTAEKTLVDVLETLSKALDTEIKEKEPESAPYPNPLAA